MWIIIFQTNGVFQSWLDRFLTGVRAFIQNINFLSLIDFVHWCPLVAIFKCSKLQSHYIFFQMHELASDIVPILYNKPCMFTGV